MKPCDIQAKEKKLKEKKYFCSICKTMNLGEYCTHCGHWGATLTPPQKLKEKKCFITDHKIQWSGDGYFCSECNTQFVSVTPPQEAEWEKELEEWWLEHEKTFAVPVAVTIDDMLIFIRKLLQEQKEKVVEETLNIMFSFEKEAGDACSASGGEDKRACDEATDWQIKREQVFNALKKKI